MLPSCSPMERPTIRPWVRRYAEDRDATLLSRIRWCVGLSLLGTLLTLGQLLVVGCGGSPMRVLFPIVYGAVCLVTGALTYAAGWERRSMGLALAFVLLLTAAMTGNFIGVRADEDSMPGALERPAKV